MTIIIGPLRRALMVLTGGLCVIFTPALANDDIIYSNDATLACLAKTDRWHALDCAGDSARACMTANRAGDTTLGMVQCYAQENAFWDARLNKAYKILVKRAKEMDASGGWVDEASIYRALRDMQRAWIPFRDAACESEAGWWRGGSHAPVAANWCVMMETARQALKLEGIVDPG
ncbi:DUF1311 domain-containing protein [Rhodobacteraceae bacterium NNCM2]|nr:DUF1311 domain-containing protein [Coraliihabitans acroporae]